MFKILLKVIKPSQDMPGLVGLYTKGLPLLELSYKGVLFLYSCLSIYNRKARDVCLEEIKELRRELV